MADQTKATGVFHGNGTPRRDVAVWKTTHIKASPHQVDARLHPSCGIASRIDVALCRRRKWRPLVTLILCASLGNLTAPQIRAQTSTAGLAVALNRVAFTAGDTMVVTAMLEPLAPARQVDAYIVVQLPNGMMMSLQLGGGLVPGIVPIARGIVPFAFTGALAQYTFGGSEPVGTYIWYSALTEPGTLNIVALKQMSFTVGVSQPAEGAANPMLGEQWALFNFGQLVGSTYAGTRGADVRAVEAWRITRGDPRVVVAIIDSGIAYDHPDLASSIWTNPGESGNGRESNGLDDDGNGFVDDWRGWDFVDGDNDPYDEGATSVIDIEGLNHGTAVASLIAARQGDHFGITGLSPEASVLAVRAVSHGVVDATIARAIDYAALMGAKVANLSFGTLVPGFALPLTAAAIERHPNVLFVTPAGNTGNNADILGTQPCTLSAINVICVAATDQHDGVAQWVAEPLGSNTGAKGVDLGAPGANMLVASIPRVFDRMGTFESADTSRWRTGGTNSSWGVTTAVRHSGNGSFADSPAGNYLPGTDSWMRIAEPLDLSGKVGCRLEMQVRHALTGNDTFFLETSTDGQLWLPRGGVGGFFLVGSNPTFRRYVVQLTSVSRLYFGFRLTSRPDSATADGVYIDDIAVSCQSDHFSSRDYVYAEGTSFAAPLVSATAALIWSVSPELSVGEVRATILGGVDPVPALQGRTSTGGRLNVVNALQRAGAASGVANLTTGGRNDGASGGPGTPAGAVIGFLTPPRFAQPVPEPPAAAPPPAWNEQIAEFLGDLTQSAVDTFVALVGTVAGTTNAWAQNFATGWAALQHGFNVFQFASDISDFLDYDQYAVEKANAYYYSGGAGNLDAVAQGLHGYSGYLDPAMPYQTRVDIAKALANQTGATKFLIEKTREAMYSGGDLIFKQ